MYLTRKGENWIVSSFEVFKCGNNLNGTWVRCVVDGGYPVASLMQVELMDVSDLELYLTNYQLIFQPCADYSISAARNFTL